jgi:hypothetical protein
MAAKTTPLDPHIQGLIEERDARTLDVHQIRGEWTRARGAWRFVGYDYAEQVWIEHTWGQS